MATVIVGALLFKILSSKRQILGVFIGLIGTLLLIWAGANFNGTNNHLYGLLILVATIGYALNVNIIKKYLTDISALAVTTGNFIFIFFPGLIVLYYTGFFDTIFESRAMQISSLYIALLALFGTAISKVLFNKMIQISTPVFASSVTYTMPIVAVLWGIIDGEQFGMLQLLAALIILFGVYLSNKRTEKK